MFNGTGREAQRRLGFGAVCLFQYLYKSYRYLYEQSHSKECPSVCRFVHARVSALSAVTEGVSPQAQGQYSVIQEQPFDGRRSSCQTQFFNESQSLSYAGQACMKLQMADTGTNFFASSFCHCNIVTLVHVKMLLVGFIGHFLTSR